MVVQALCLPPIGLQWLALRLRVALIALSPSFALCDGLFAVNANYEYSRLCSSPVIEFICADPQLMKMPCCPSESLLAHPLPLTTGFHESGALGLPFRCFSVFAVRLSVAMWRAGMEYQRWVFDFRSWSRPPSVGFRLNSPRRRADGFCYCNDYFYNAFPEAVS